MSDIFTITAVAAVGTILSLMLKATRPELAAGVAIATGIWILGVLSKDIAELVSGLKSLIGESGVDELQFEGVLKAIAIAYITHFGALLCRDSGESMIAAKVELAGKTAILLITLPIICELLELIKRTISEI